MDILPPRRRGQLGAFSVGGGTQSGGFKVQSGAAPASTSAAPPRPQSATDQMASRSPSAPLRPGPSIAVSDQVKMLQVSAAQDAAKKVAPKGQADVFGPAPKVLVQSYAPPPNTPAITRPATLPNENANTIALANQKPTNTAEAAQKALAQQGLPVPLSTAAQLVPAAPVASASPIVKLFAEITKTTGKSPWAALVEWGSLYQKGATREILSGKIPAVALLGGVGTASSVESTMRSWLASVSTAGLVRPAVNLPAPIPAPANAPAMQKAVAGLRERIDSVMSRVPFPSRTWPQLNSWIAKYLSGAAKNDLLVGIKLVAVASSPDRDIQARVGSEIEKWLVTAPPPALPAPAIQPVGATSAPPPLPRPSMNPPLPVPTPGILKAATVATSATISAKIAEQAATTKTVLATAAAKDAALKALELARSEDLKKAAIEKAKAEAAALEKKQAAAVVVLTSQTVTEVEKAKVESELRAQADAKALAEQRVVEVVAEQKELSIEAKKAMEEAKFAEDAAKKAAIDSEMKSIDAVKAQQTVVVEETKAVVEQAKAEEQKIVGAAQFATMAPKVEPKPEDKPGMPTWQKAALGLGTVAVLAYALRPKVNLNGAPKLIELDDEE